MTKMTKRIDLKGHRFGRLLVEEFDHSHSHNGAYWKCVCDCGNKKIVLGSNLTNGSTKSCGCLAKENREIFTLNTMEWKKRPRVFGEVTKICEICGEEYKTKGHYSRFCKKCYKERRTQKNNEYYQSNEELVISRSRINKLKRVYNLTKEGYEELLAIQNGKCAICEKQLSKKNLDIDHDHVTGKVRGLLCNQCNQGIALLQENPQLLQKAANYLSREKL
jgi:hypothetical protein